MRTLILFILSLVVGIKTVSAREWKSADGSRTFSGQMVEYRPPSVTVILKDGKKMTFSEKLLSPADQRYCYLAERVLERSFPQIPYKVIQVLEDGILCQELPDNNRYFSGETMFIWGKFRNSVADGEVYRSDIYWAGSYSYTSVENIDRTIRSFARSLDKAVVIWENRLAPRDGSAAKNDRNSKHAQESFSATGSGFAITETGYVVTNAHVVEGAVKVEVRSGQTFVEAKVVAIDQQNDLAILKIEAATTPIRLNTDTSPKLGDDIVVGGFPNPGMQGTSLKLTKGVISSLKGMQDDVRHFQIDASIQPGNSGGPLVSSDGSVVGVVNAKLNDSAVVLATGSVPQNVNYAIKIDYLVPLLRSIDGLAELVKSAKVPDALSIGERLEKSACFILCQLKSE
ncbi:S1C family serine protease [Prosthecobacter sp.]|uniref:S1C family serine protease n=1 Tax=Prosthecobacter sp. TaxID=1965333 RepID=UPI003782E4D7